MSKKKKILKIRKKWKTDTVTKIHGDKNKKSKLRIRRKLKKLNRFIRTASSKDIMKYLEENDK